MTAPSTFGHTNNNLRFTMTSMNPSARTAVALHGLVTNKLGRGWSLEQIRDCFFDADTDLELIEAYSEPEWLQSVLIEARAAQ